MCLSPVYLRDTKTFVPCGKCGECLKERGSEWRFRLMYQCKLSKIALWCTFTYADAYSLCKEHVQTLLRSFDDFFKPVKRVNGKRKRVQSVIMKYYLIGEYGTHTYRPHYHAILFFDYGKDYKDGDMELNCVSLIPFVASKWSYGMVNITQCNLRVVNYICDTHLYLMNNSLSVDPRLQYGLYPSTNEPTFRLFSKGLGKLPNGSIPWSDYYYIKRHRYYRFGQMKISIPKDWKDRYFNDKEKDLMKKYAMKQLPVYVSKDDPEYVFVQDASMKNSIRSRIIKKTQL